MFRTILVANRGEIAVRIMRTLRAMGVRSVAVYTEADEGALHVAMADEAVFLGDGAAYLDVDAVVAAAASRRCDGLHPGYGFLSENAALARRCEAEGIVFIGPPPDAIETMGDKIRAKQAVAAAGVPVVPGRHRAGMDDAELAAAALEIGLPVLFKPAAGGGGKGMRRVDDPGALTAAVEAARREALAAFGDSSLLVERFVSRPRHIEVQVFADRHGLVTSLGERECSLQRRHQKIVEETPSRLLDQATREAMESSAVAAASACGYVGAGTVEFIVSGTRPDEYFFLEMNTRLQVEHPVTEAVLGVDLVEWQLRVAAGAPLPWGRRGPDRRGHAVEARVYAEDPARGFLPAAGVVRSLHEPTGRPHVRVDSGLRAGTAVGTEYDPMLSKVVAWAEDRSEALARLDGALRDTHILGVTNNVGFLRRLVTHPDVLEGRIDTELVERLAGDLTPDPAPPEVLAAAALLEALRAAPDGPVLDPWDICDGWRIGAPAPAVSQWQVAGQLAEVSVGPAAVEAGGSTFELGGARIEGSDVVVVLDGVAVRYGWTASGDQIWLGRDGDTWALMRVRETIDRTGSPTAGTGPLTSPMPGTVLAVHVNAGEQVRAGQALVVVEAMKMEHSVVAPADGRVTDVYVRVGDRVSLDQALARVES